MPTVIADAFTSLHSSVSYRFMCFDALLLGAHVRDFYVFSENGFLYCHVTPLFIPDHLLYFEAILGS